jgi:hypothetical protein
MSAIFISHGSRDDADAMAAWLRKQGHTSYFIDYDEKSGIIAGTDWEQVLHQRLRQCQAFVAIVTPEWLESKWCFAEIILARGSGKPVFLVIVRPCQLPDLLSDTQKVDLAADPKGGYRRLGLGLSEHGLDPSNAFVRDPARPRIRALLPFKSRMPRHFSDVVQIFSRHARQWKDFGATIWGCHGSFSSWVLLR